MTLVTIQIHYHIFKPKAKILPGSGQAAINNKWENKIVTEIVPFYNFYKAETNHQNFYRDNPNYGYCGYE